VDAALAKVGELSAAANPRVVCFPNGHDFETYIVHASPEYLDVVKSVIIENKAVNEKHRHALEREWRSKDEAAVIEELKSAKTQYGARLPAGFAQLSNKTLQVPERIRRVLDLSNPPIPESSAKKGAR
jgi:hypothetical protein